MEFLSPWTALKITTLHISKPLSSSCWPVADILSTTTFRRYIFQERSCKETDRSVGRDVRSNPFFSSAILRFLLCINIHLQAVILQLISDDFLLPHQTLHARKNHQPASLSTNEQCPMCGPTKLFFDWDPEDKRAAFAKVFTTTTPFVCFQHPSTMPRVDSYFDSQDLIQVVSSSRRVKYSSGA